MKGTRVRTAREALDLALSEDELKASIIACAKLYGWRVHHQRPCRTNTGWRTAIEGDAGFPDLVLCRPPRLIVWELKRQDDRTYRATEEQQAWLRGFMGCGVSTGIIRPSDWSGGLVERVLSGEVAG